MNKKLIITSIAKDDNRILKIIRDGCLENNVELIIVGDKKSPKDFKLKNSTFLSIEDQKALGFRLEKALPYNHYCRKNIGYLEAIRRGANVIVDTDDDNIPKKKFWDITFNVEKLSYIENAGWINVYKYFTNKKVWPRGFPLNKVLSEPPPIESFKNAVVKVPIWQGLADENPDVDAIYRMIGELPIYFNEKKNIALGVGSICPFNSQNTQFFSEAYPLLYLPAFCSFRMTDIWRSFVAQVISWKFDWFIGYSNSTVTQERNIHNQMLDFRDEIEGYLNNEKILESLMSVGLSSNQDKIYDNMLVLYEEMVRKNFIDAREIELLSNWIEDLKSIVAK